MKQIYNGLCGLILLGLAGCDADAPTPTAYCPNVAVLAQANALTNYLPGRTDVAAQVTQAKITGVAGSCALSKKNTLLTVRFQAGFAATNGPANDNAPVVLPYFISISRGDTIIQKQNYSITLSFDGNNTTASGTSKPVKIELANVPDSAATDILVGFQLSQAQLSGQ